MKAPKKLFIKPEKITVEMIPGGELPNVGIQYIRKDALLEWAKRLKEKWEEPPMSRHSPGCVFMLEQVIAKIESL